MNSNQSTRHNRRHRTSWYDQISSERACGVHGGEELLETAESVVWKGASPGLNLAVQRRVTN